MNIYNGLLLYANRHGLSFECAVLLRRICTMYYMPPSQMQKFDLEKQVNLSILTQVELH